MRICVDGDPDDVGCEGSTMEEEYCAGDVSVFNVYCE